MESKIHNFSASLSSSNNKHHEIFLLLPADLLWHTSHNHFNRCTFVLMFTTPSCSRGYVAKIVDCCVFLSCMPQRLNGWSHTVFSSLCPPKVKPTNPHVTINSSTIFSDGRRQQNDGGAIILRFVRGFEMMCLIWRLEWGETGATWKVLVSECHVNSQNFWSPWNLRARDTLEKELILLSPLKSRWHRWQCWEEEWSCYLSLAIWLIGA